MFQLKNVLFFQMQFPHLKLLSISMLFFNRLDAKEISTGKLLLKKQPHYLIRYQF